MVASPRHVDDHVDIWHDDPAQDLYEELKHGDSNLLSGFFRFKDGAKYGE